MRPPAFHSSDARYAVTFLFFPRARHSRLSRSRTVSTKTTGQALRSSPRHKATAHSLLETIFSLQNPEFIRRGIAEKAANAVLIKLNQIGTVSETVSDRAVPRSRVGIRHIPPFGRDRRYVHADFAVAMGGGQIKTGSASRSERIAKYNRLLEIEAELGAAAEFRSPFGR